MAKDLAIVLNNGSLHSAVTTALAAQKYRLIFVHAEVAQNPGSRARAAYDAQVAHVKPYREHTLAMPYLSAVESSAAKPQPLADPRQPVAVGSVAVGLLPIVAAAARFAVHYQAAAVHLGLRVGSGPDELAQATEYLQIWNELLQLPCGHPDLAIEAPLLELEPWQVIDTGFQVSAPFEKTWSCQEETGDPCWACRGCRAREAAFQQAGKPDPMRVVKKL